MVVFDATFLSHLLYPRSRPPLDPSTKQPVKKAKERIESLEQRGRPNRLPGFRRTDDQKNLVNGSDVPGCARVGPAGTHQNRT